jgi:threonine synthase
MFPVGCATAGFEIWEQLGFSLPEAVVVACGYGSQVLGLLYALEALGSLRRCRVVAVNSTAYPSLQRAFAAGRPDTEPAGAGPSLAEGIACRNPVRGTQLLAGVRATQGTVVAVGDDEISNAAADLATTGLLVEPTSAVAFAGWRRLRDARWFADPADACVVLSGSGLKTVGRLTSR